MRLHLAWACAFILAALFAALAPAAAALSAATLDGEWEMVAVCRGQQAKVTLQLFDDRGGKWSSNVYYWTWDGDQQGKIITNWNVKGSMGPDASTIVLEPQFYAMDIRGPNAKRFAVTFRKINGNWVGEIADPECDRSARFVRPGAPKAIASTGRALTTAPWMGRSPMIVVGGQNFFQFAGFNVSTFLNEQERRADTHWSPVTEVTSTVNAVVVRVQMSGLATIACFQKHCDDRQGQRIFLVYPGPRQAYFAARTGSTTEFCLFDRGQWSCFQKAVPIPAGNVHMLANWASGMYTELSDQHRPAYVAPTARPTPRPCYDYYAPGC